MSLESLLVYLEADREQTNLVRIAADIAAQHGSSITGLSALGIRPPFVANGIAVDVGGEAEIDQMKLSLATREAWFRHVAKEKGRSVEWRSGFESPTQRLIHDAACADLVIMSAVREIGDVYRRPDIGEVILRAGRPILVVPDSADTLKADRVVLGWKNTREARRVLLDAMPFLARASEVTIVEICEHADSEAALAEAAAVRRYLDKHQIKGSYEFIARPTGPVGQQLVAIAHQIKADLIVSGAYGHTRLGEWIFGGATHELLSGSDVCCLMSH
jgi:nucleotide-binding universal stress UspA family protein